ncbi:MAG: response regulator [Deltaproteobacteria bacterium]|nr:response regulator [Deltaproteobacteria bacterium]MCW5801413.1 response regulator [Deltaproteobacteria bacterium]
MERFILRAEISTGDETVVSYAYDLTPVSVFVVTDWHPELDTWVAVRLSFPRLLEPVELAARVADHRPAGAPGDTAGIVLAFDRQRALAGLLAEVEAARTLASDRRRYRMLLVEDNSLTRDVFSYSASKFFHGADLSISYADTAEAAWEQLAVADFDVVIVDYFLPTSDGAALISRLRGDRRLRGIPIVAISIGGQPAREATLSAGADLYVDKPLVFRDLFNTLRILARFAPPLPTQAELEKRTILVLDDSPLALAVSRAALEGAGFTVVIAENLATFEAQRLACKPDLILVDVQMPEAFGDDVVATLLGGKGVDVPVVLFSSLDEAELARRTVESRATGYICKGSGMGELVRRCKELLGGAA